MNQSQTTRFRTRNLKGLVFLRSSDSRAQRWGESKGCLIKGCLNSTKTAKEGREVLKAGIPTVGIPKTGIPKAGILKEGQTHTGTLFETEIPKPGKLKKTEKNRKKRKNRNPKKQQKKEKKGRKRKKGEKGKQKKKNGKRVGSDTVPPTPFAKSRPQG